MDKVSLCREKIYRGREYQTRCIILKTHHLPEKLGMVGITDKYDMYRVMTCTFIRDLLNSTRQLL